MNFKLEMKDDDRTVTVEFSTFSISGFDERCRDFLRGCGFVFLEEDGEEMDE